jgi:hypothetical protein
LPADALPPVFVFWARVAALTAAISEIANKILFIALVLQRFVNASQSMTTKGAPIDGSLMRRILEAVAERPWYGSITIQL